MKRKNLYSRILSAIILLVALLIIFFALRRSHKAYEPGMDEFFHRVSEINMVRYATFSGLETREGKLIFTFDPSQKVGKRTCPT